VAVACGVLGSILGALANYGLAAWLGRAFFLRLGKYVLITERALDRSERYFAAHGEISTFLVACFRRAPSHLDFRRHRAHAPWPVRGVHRAGCAGVCTI